MRYFKFAKLVRDNIVDYMESNNQTVYGLRKLDDDSFVIELLKKLQEEANEASLAEDREEIIKELADVQEIIDYLKTVLQISDEDFAIEQERKRNENGSFNKRLYIEAVSVDDEMEWLDYYLKNPDKYPEVEKPTN